MSTPLPPAETGLSSARRGLLITGAVIGSGLALLAVTFAGIALVSPVPWRPLAGAAAVMAAVLAVLVFRRVRGEHVWIRRESQ
jgi:hypothetical protein